MERLIGTKGIYRIIDTIGSGGMADVLRVKRVDGDGVFALKKLKENSSEIAARQLDNEIRVLKQLNKEGVKGIPKLIDVGDGFCVMEYIEGTNLKKKSLGGKDCLIIMEKLADILVRMHEASRPVIFLDLKPANVLVTEEGDVYLIDFGTAMILESYKELHCDQIYYGQYHNTHSKMLYHAVEGTGVDEYCGENRGMSGTKGYAAPEQYGGLGAADIRTDIYAFGRMLERLILRKKTDPFLYEELLRVVKGCTGVRKGMRYRDFREARKALGECGKRACTGRNGFIISCVIWIILLLLSAVLAIGALLPGFRPYYAIVSALILHFWWNRETFIYGRQIASEYLRDEKIDADEIKQIDIVLTCNSIDF